MNLVELFHCVVWLGSVRFRTTQFSSARFVFPLQFSISLEWAGLFTFRYSCTVSTTMTPEKRFHSMSLHQALTGSAPQLSTRGQTVLPQQSMKQPFLGLLKERCAHSKQLHLILGWFKYSSSVVSRAASSITQAVTIFFGQSVISRIYTSRFGNAMARLEPWLRWY